MNARLHKSFAIQFLFAAAILVALLCASHVSQAQALFGSASTTNSATNISNLAFGYDALFSLTTAVIRKGRSKLH